MGEFKEVTSVQPTFAHCSVAPDSKGIGVPVIRNKSSISFCSSDPEMESFQELINCWICSPVNNALFISILLIRSCWLKNRQNSCTKLVITMPRCCLNRKNTIRSKSKKLQVDELKWPAGLIPSGLRRK